MVVQDAFLVQQGNIYVTLVMTKPWLAQYRLTCQQMARLLALQHRDELLALQLPIVGGHVSSLQSRWPDVQDGHIEIASDLLVVLQSIPIQVIGALCDPDPSDT